MTESLGSPATERKAEQEIAEFRRYQEVSRAFLEVNEKICRLRPVEETLSSMEKNGSGHPAGSRSVAANHLRRLAQDGQLDLEAIEMAVRASGVGLNRPMRVG